MKAIYLILATFLFLSCGSYKETQNTEKSAKESISERNSEKETNVNSIKTPELKLGMDFDIEDLIKEASDFSKTISASNGSEINVKKTDGKINISATVPETETKTTEVKEKEQEFRYDSEYIFKESNKLVKRIPFKFWIYILIALIVYYRKNVAGLLCWIFPQLRAFKLFSMILGSKKED